MMRLTPQLRQCAQLRLRTGEDKSTAVVPHIVTAHFHLPFLCASVAAHYFDTEVCAQLRLRT